MVNRNSGACYQQLTTIQQQRLRIPERLFGRTRTAVWAYANGCLGIRKR